MSPSLRDLLEHHVPTDDKERADLEAMRAFAATLPSPFARDQWPAHFTGSAVVATPDSASVLLVLHAKLGRWLQPGGHADPIDEGAMEATALREAREESGLDVALHPTAPRPLDVDVHVIPARRADPEHRHLDVRYLVLASNPNALSFDPAEAHGAQWLSWDEALERADEAPLRRLLLKARAVLRGA